MRGMQGKKRNVRRINLEKKAQAVTIINDVTIILWKLHKKKRKTKNITSPLNRPKYMDVDGTEYQRRAPTESNQNSYNSNLLKTHCINLMHIKTF